MQIYDFSYASKTKKHLHVIVEDTAINQVSDFNFLGLKP